MNRYIEKEMIDRLLVLQERTVVALEKIYSELSRLSEQIEKLEDSVVCRSVNDEKVFLWLKVLAGFVGIIVTIIALLQTLRLR